MKLFKFTLFSLLFLFSSYLTFAADTWTFEKEDEGIKVYKREVVGSPLLAFKGEGIVNAPLDVVASVVFDTTRAHEWIPDLVSSKILKWIDRNTYIEYDHIGTPIVIKDRDFVSLVKITLDIDKSALYMVYENTKDDTLAPKTGYVRGDLMNTTFIFSKGNKPNETYVVGEVHVDPKGAIPHWLANLFQKDWPVDTFKALRAQVKKKDIKADPQITERVLLLEKKNQPLPSTQ